MIRLPAADIRRAVRLGLEEDLMDGDVTTSSLFPDSHTGLRIYSYPATAYCGGACPCHSNFSDGGSVAQAVALWP